MIVDAGPIVAAANRKDRHHAASLDLLSPEKGPFIVPPPVVAEVCHLLQRDAGPRVEAQFLRSFVAGHFAVAELKIADLDRMADLVDRYADFPLGGVDASVIALAERLGVTEIATLDRRHFGVVRPKHVEAFTLLPN
ncbi:type II toxin-antitoxin system VapC family toxin [Frankia sp. Cr1]|uniref:type II toxin-antitoxin system VapC family toxin n=1 Tax=Frankia sp. Cr1 TaxID=3073931 RepID=UPI002AD5024B|nr:PIN domain-containing protein [Frankia sp. Cr1]